ncbi:MAG: AAA domain-containing protein [Chlorobiota bacterium]
MIAEDNYTAYANEILGLINSENTDSKSKLIETYSLFKSLVNEIVAQENSKFLGIYPKLLFIKNKYGLDEVLFQKINSYRKFVVKSNKNPELYVSQEDLNSAISVLIIILFVVADKSEHSQLEKFLNNEPIIDYSSGEDKKNESFDFAVTNRSNSESEKKVVFGESEEVGKVAIYLSKSWESIWDIAKQYTNIKAIELEYRDERKGYSVYTCTKDTFLVYEPNYLVDVTEVANCFQNKSESEYLALLSWLSLSTPSVPMLIGNIVNNLFDSIISGLEIDIDSFIDSELSKAPLQYFYLNEYSKNELSNIKDKVESIYITMCKSISHIPKGHTFIEPSFISPQYGLQGRLDALVVNEDNENLKDVIELKSGSFPKSSFKTKTKTGLEYSMNVWRNNYIQASCYNLILSSVYPKRIGNSAIYYAKDVNAPLRNVPIVANTYREIVEVRNRIVSLYFELAAENLYSISKLSESVRNVLPPYSFSNLTRFEDKLINSTDLAHSYFKVMLAFTYRELLSNKVGLYSDRSENSYSNLWLEHSKIKNRNVHSNLVLNFDESDFEVYHLNFYIITESITSFRIGDQIIVYPTDEFGNSLLLEEQILKGVIKYIDKRTVIVSLRNKVLGTMFLNKYNYWALESDFYESTYKKLPAIILDFLDDKDFAIKVGAEEQKINAVNCSFDYLNNKQNEVVAAAIAANSYYLIQGPPGTGKTSYTMRAIVEYYYENTNGNILLTAYTNRAVDQICKVLKERTEYGFIRLGSKESSIHNDVLLSKMSETYSKEELETKFKKVRIVVTTVASALTHPELFELKEFDLAVVDEAAQILEPYIVNILHRTKKTVFIGDEKQLPAIVTQGKDSCLVQDENLIDIELKDLSNSYFQRMVQNASNRGWAHSHGMLTHQGRMSQPIMQIANDLFYSGMLKVVEEVDFNNWNTIEFHSSEPEYEPFVNLNEANYVLGVVEKLKGDENTKDLSIGVISPFRSQCALIKNLLVEYSNSIDVDTVERYQGSERDIIIISFAVNSEEHLQNMQSNVIIDEKEIDRKLNVAITRAKYGLFVTGCKNILCKSSVYSNFINLLESELD